MARISLLPTTAFPSLLHEFPASKDGETHKLTIEQVRELMEFKGSEISASLLTADDTTVQAYLEWLRTNKVDNSDLDDFYTKTAMNSLLETNFYTEAEIDGLLSTRLRVDQAQDFDVAQKIQARANIGVPIKGYISDGFNLVRNAADPTNDLDFPVGVVASDQSMLMSHPAGTAQLDVAYGTGNGGRFDATLSDGTWNAFVISNGTLVSRGLSKSLDPTTQPNWPAGFSHYRRVGSILRRSGAISPFRQFENYFFHSTRITDVSVINPGTAAVTRTLTVPTGFPVLAFGKAAIIISPASGVNVRFLLLSALNQPDNDPVAIGGTIAITTPAVPSATAHRAQGDFLTETNSSGQIRSRVNLSEDALNILVLTEGWIDFRGKA